MKVLVTGGAGYLGSVLIRRLLENDHHVRVLDKLLFGRGSLAEVENHPRFQLYEGDISNVTDVNHAMTDVNAVIDLAAIVGDPACSINGDLSVRTNYWATKLLAEVAESRGVEKFLFASTCSVYGASKGALSTEDGWTNPLSLYAETKLDSEKALLEMEGNLNPIILRLATLCGPSHRMRFDLVLNIMTATAYFENEVRIFGGEQYRPLLDVRDAARAFHMLLEMEQLDDGPSLFNVGSETHNVTIGDLGRQVAEVMGDVPIINKPDIADQRSYKVDFSRIRRLGFNDVLSLDQSIRGVANLFTSNFVTDYKENRYYNSRYDYE